MSYNEIFGGSAVYPSNQTYTAITLGADTQLSWPIESVSSNVIVADLMDITPTLQNGWSLLLPDATGSSTGITMILNNVDPNFSFNVKDDALNLIVSIAPGTVWLLYLADNSTLAGVWRAFQYGAQSGSVNVAAIAGAGLKAIGTSLNQSMPVSAKGTNYTAVDDDRGSVILWTGAGGTLTLPTASAVANNWFINVRNSGTGDLTVSPPSGTIDGAASKTFTSGVGSAIVFTDGSNYYTLGYGGASTVGGFDYTTINAAGSDGVTGPVILAGGQLNRISYKVFGILTGTRTIQVPTTVQQYWINNQTTSSGGPWTLTVKTASGTGQTISQPGQAIVYCDGTDVQPGQSGISLPVTVASGGTGATTAPAARTNLGSTATGDALFTAASAAAARTALGAGTVGGNVFVSATASAALTAMAGGVMTGGFTVSTTFGATGTITGGGLVVTAATVVANGLNLRGANQLGFRTNSVEAGYFDASQNLTLTHPLAIGSGGTGSSTVAAAATALGDPLATANTLVQRNASADILARIFNMNFAADNLTISHVMYQQGSDGYLRRMTLANFNAQISPDSLSTVSGGSAPSYSARAWGSFNTAGTLVASQNIASCTRSSAGVYGIVFTTAMANANYSVVAMAQHVAANFIVAAHLAEAAVVVKNTTQFGIQVINSGGAIDANVSFVVYS